ncbi:MAG: hypothetical protein ACOC56_03505 [Atribacterota bacterium]
MAIFSEKILDILQDLITISEKIQKKIQKEDRSSLFYLKEFATIKLSLPRQIGKTHALLLLARTRFSEECIILAPNERSKKDLIDRCKEFGYTELQHNIFNIRSIECLEGLGYKKAILIDNYDCNTINMNKVYEKTIPLFKEQPYFYIIVS